MAALLEEDEVTLMLAQHHVSEARRLLADGTGRDAADAEETLRSVEALLEVIEQHLYRLRRPAFRR